MNHYSNWLTSLVLTQIIRDIFLCFTAIQVLSHVLY